MTNKEVEFAIDDQLAQALTSAIASRADGNPGHALFITAEIVMYITTIMGADIPDFLSVLKEVGEQIDFSHVRASQLEEVPPDEQNEVEVKVPNAPYNDTTQ